MGLDEDETAFFSEIVSIQVAVILPTVWNTAQKSLVSVRQGCPICPCMVINLGSVHTVGQTGKRGHLVQKGPGTKHYDRQGSV